jgi:predicted MFS family arabinose efflux permease
MRVDVTGSALRVWLAVIVLGVASFTMVTTEFAPIGLLSQIAFDLGQDQAAVGLAVTLYAWIGAASGLLSAVLLQRCPRKPLLVVLMLVLSATNLAAMHSHSLEALMLARAVGAVVHGFFWAMAAAIAAQIAPLDRMGVATAIVFGGISMATVIGVPLVNLIGQTSGWRTAFGVIGAVGLFASGLMAGLLPQIQAGSPTGWRALAAVLRRRDLQRIYAVTAFMAAANFAAYTFIEPFLGQIPDVPPVMIGVMLFGFGGAGFLGNVLTGFLIDRFMKSVITWGLLALAVAALFAGLQTWILRAAGSAAMPAAAIHSAVINSAIGTGATLGARILNVSDVSGVMLVAGEIVIVPLLIMLLHARSPKRSDGVVSSIGS